MIENEKIEAEVKAYLEIDQDEDLKYCKHDFYGLTVIEIWRQEYAIAETEEEADEACKEYIRDSLWAFNASFLASETELPEEVFEIMSQACESSNEAILKIVEKTCGLDALVKAAIAADGRGNYLSSYDCEEIELNSGALLYRMN
jgi:hypothetical protein